MTIKLALISHFPPIEGGISKYSKRTADLFKKNGVEVDSLRVGTLTESLKLLPLLTKKKYHLIRLEFAISMYSLASIIILIQLVLLKLLRPYIKLTVNYHEVKRDTDRLGPFGHILYIAYSAVFDLIFVHTKEAKRILINNCKVKSEKIYVFPLGLYYLTPIKKRITTKKVILFFGYIHIDKGIEFLIDAYKLLIKSDSKFLKNTQLIIAGAVRKRTGLFKLFQKIDDKYYKSLIDRTSSANYYDNFKFIGYVEDSKVLKLFSEASVVVLPYTLTEQSGVLNQVLPFKIPIIATNISGLKETLKTTGILVKPKNSHEIYKALKKLLNDKTYYKSVQKKYNELINHLNPEKIIKNEICIYYRICQHD